MRKPCLRRAVQAAMAAVILMTAVPVMAQEAELPAAPEGPPAKYVVRILVPGNQTDAVPVQAAGRSYYEELLSAGVRIFEFQPAMMHAKTIVVDGAWSIVGSANMDVRSKELNSENVLGILDEGFAREMEATFFEDLKKSQEIRLEEWRRRGWWQKTKERVAVLFAEQY